MVKSMSRLSKRASYLLRHGAVREGLKIDKDGCVLVSDLLNHKLISELGASVKDIEIMVDKDVKHRYSLVSKNHHQFIKANQG